ncbi:MAG TPA: CBS domain-containing protein [Candidatus Limnocylindria bacterium]|nr:CBS domain-containing protein [Candidatus Limnocylindria bacterium]
MKVSEIMTREPSTLAPASTIGEAATIMRQDDCGSVPIVESGRLVGIITDRDIVIRVLAGGKDPKTTRVSEAMTADPVTVSPDTSVDEAQKVMAERQVRRLPVVEDGRLVGLVVIGQVARRDSAKDVGQTLKEVSEKTTGRSSHARG